MKSFRFSLQSLRVLRVQKERVTQKRYVEALRASDEAAAKMDAGSHELAAAWMALCAEVTEGATIRDREALDRLREKNRRVYERAAQREEQKQLDEMGLRLNSPASSLCEAFATSMESA